VRLNFVGKHEYFRTSRASLFWKTKNDARQSHWFNVVMTTLKKHALIRHMWYSPTYDWLYRHWQLTFDTPLLSLLTVTVVSRRTVHQQLWCDVLWTRLKSQRGFDRQGQNVSENNRSRQETVQPFRLMRNVDSRNDIIIGTRRRQLESGCLRVCVVLM